MSLYCFLIVVISFVGTTHCYSDSILYRNDPGFTPGSQCLTTNGEPGSCTKVQNCLYAFANRSIKPKICGFQGRDSFICCQTLSSYTRISTGKKCFPKDKVTHLVKGLIGGIKSASSEFPHMVALGYGDQKDIKWRCGGSLISDNYVLTAAHCLYSREDGDVKYVRAGTVTLTNPERSAQDFGIETVIPHPQYNFPAGYNDIALIKLNDTIEETRSVKPACLHTNSTIDGQLITMGWGHLYHGGDPSNDLMKVNLVQYSHTACDRVFTKDKWTVPDGINKKMMICAGGEENEEKDTCQGDSGGPLQLKTREHVIVGVTSFGKVCGTPNIPGVYTRVSNYIDWIEKMMTPQN